MKDAHQFHINQGPKIATSFCSSPSEKMFTAATNCCEPGSSKSYKFIMNDMKGGNFSQTYQHVEDGTLTISVALPGIKKESINLRAKPDKLSLSAERKDELADMFGSKKVNVSFDLHEHVIPDSAKAKYVDGILYITFPISDPGFVVTNVD
ncbi:MAG: Hsp20/alpha crystallin family protein [Candidatus Heimdallarchaeota archaeon]|nr:Hsp20/alpha crystallin family protein [Candidatus Heimdallarchaeota archaeon]MDH5644873.1 Hsp20/alpha crystallin family protein [Candidatus Heimdallarchaeota archaeon]